MNLTNSELTQIISALQFKDYSGLIFLSIALVSALTASVITSAIKKNNERLVYKEIEVTKYSGNFKIYYTHIPFGSNRKINAEVIVNIPNDMRIERDETGMPIPSSKYKFNTAIRKNISRHRNHQMIDDIDCVAIEDISPAFTLEDPKKMQSTIEQYEMKVAEKVDSSNENLNEYQEAA